MTKALTKTSTERALGPKASGASHPVAIYLASLAPSGRPSMLSGLAAVAAIVDQGATPLSLPWGKLRYEHLQAVRARLVEGYSPRSVNRMLAAIRGVLKVAWNLRQISTDEYTRAIQVKSVPARSLPPSGRSLAKDELKRVFAGASELPAPGDARACALLVMLYAGGLRRQEVSSLDVADYDGETGAVTVRRGKGAKSRIAYIPTAYRDLLKPWLTLRSSGPLFVRFNRYGVTAGRLGRKGINYLLEEIRARAGVAQFSPHDLRRSFGTHLLDAGADILMVQELMGHADLKTTKIYDRRGERGKQSAIERLPMAVDLREHVSAAYSSSGELNLADLFTVDDPLVGTSDPRTILRLQSLLDDGSVVCEHVTLPEAGPSPKLFGGRTEAHKDLCSRAAGWLVAQKLGYSSAPSTLHYPGGVADVVDKNGRLFVECGYTRADKVLLAIDRGLSVMIVPHGDVGGFWFKRGDRRTRRKQ